MKPMDNFKIFLFRICHNVTSEGKLNERKTSTAKLNYLCCKSLLLNHLIPQIQISCIIELKLNHQILWGSQRYRDTQVK